MRSPLARAAACAAAVACAACAGGKGPLYHWNGYDQALYKHYRAPQDREAYVASLWAVIEAARADGNRVPPGIYAEYGYALFEEGRTAESIPWFELEAKEWPESQLLMQKMVRNARLKGATAPAGPATTGPAGALPGGKAP